MFINRTPQEGGCGFFTLSEALAFEDSPEASLLGTMWCNFAKQKYTTAEAAEPACRQAGIKETDRRNQFPLSEKARASDYLFSIFGMKGLVDFPNLL